MATKEQVLASLAAVKGPDGAPLTQTGKLSDVVVSDGKVFFSITVDAAVVQQWEPVRKAAEAAVTRCAGRDIRDGRADRRACGGRRARRASAREAARQRAWARPRATRRARRCKGRPASARSSRSRRARAASANPRPRSISRSGLRDLGLKVGVLDADIYGPSVPKLLAIRGRPETLGGNRLRPMQGYGLTVMSIGFLVAEDTPMIWRGPMVMSALTQMLREVEWGTLDIMIVDMPPGTGDAQLTMAQQVPLAGAVIVSTPQDLALIDARRGVEMFKRVNVPVLGIIENMSYFVCPKCGERHDIFGHGGAHAEADKLGVPFLGEVPLHMAIRETSDSGRPVVATDPDGPHAKVYREIAQRVREQLAGKGAGRAAPKIVIEA